MGVEAEGSALDVIVKYSTGAKDTIRESEKQRGQEGRRTRGRKPYRPFSGGVAPTVPAEKASGLVRCPSTGDQLVQSQLSVRGDGVVKRSTELWAMGPKWRESEGKCFR